MYIESISIENLKSISDLRWDLNGRNPEGWHVILGDNGTGKTTFLRGVCLALLGDRDANYLVPDWNANIRYGATSAFCEVVVRRDAEFDIFPPEIETGDEFEAFLGEDEKASQAAYEQMSARTPTIFHGGLQITRVNTELVYARENPGRIKPKNAGSLRSDPASDQRDYRQHGWFSAAYGPFRRFTGGDKDEENSLLSRPVVGRHMSVFKEKVALSEPIQWIMSLYIEELKNSDRSLQDLKEFINQDGFLPNGVRFDHVTSKDVLFTDAGGATVRIEDLSDGYRSVLCMTLELIRQLSLAYIQTPLFDKGEAITVAVPGVVLIDEVDVHLHPSWQRAIGPWFRKHFPKIQFIVTTHSPLVCQAAEHGTVYSLSGADSEQESHFIEGADLKRLLYGDILDAYSTELFGADVDRSPQAQAFTKRLAQLNIAELDRALTESEKKEQKELRRTLPTSAYTVSL